MCKIARRRAERQPHGRCQLLAGAVLPDESQRQPRAADSQKLWRCPFESELTSRKGSSGRLLCASLRSRKERSRKERSRKEKVKEGKVKEVLCRSGAAHASSSAAFPKQQLGERSRIVVAAQFALAHPRGVAAGRKERKCAGGGAEDECEECHKILRWTG